MTYQDTGADQLARPQVSIPGLPPHANRGPDPPLQPPAPHQHDRELTAARIDLRLGEPSGRLTVVPGGAAAPPGAQSPNSQAQAQGTAA